MNLFAYLKSLFSFQKVTFTKLFPIYIPVGIYMFKVNNKNTRTMCEICSKLTIKTPWTCFTPCSCSSVSIAKFEKVNADWNWFPWVLFTDILLRYFASIFLSKVSTYNYFSSLLIDFKSLKETSSFSQFLVRVSNTWRSLNLARWEVTKL